MHNTNQTGKYRLICMSFDGEFQTEQPIFNSTSEAWDYSNDLGSKWFFYPFHFVVTATGKTIRDTPETMQHLNGLRTKQVAAIFKTASQKPENLNLDAEAFQFCV